MKAEKIVLVYQAGIANVFEVETFNLSNFGRNAIRLVQDDFHTCEVYCLGRQDAGDIVRVAGCNEAGNISESHWTDQLDELPFSDSFAYQLEWLR